MSSTTTTSTTGHLQHFHPNYLEKSRRRSDEPAYTGNNNYNKTIFLELRSTTEWNEDVILNHVQREVTTSDHTNGLDDHKKVQVTVKLRLSYSRQLASEKITRAMDTLQTIKTMVAESSMTRHDIYFVLECMEVNFDFLMDFNNDNDTGGDSFQTSLGLIHAVQNGLFDQIIINRSFGTRMALQEPMALALATAATKHTLKRLYLSNMDLKTNLTQSHESSRIFWNAIQTSTTLEEMTLALVDLDFDCFYHAITNNYSLKSIIIVNYDLVIAPNHKKFQELLHHVDLNICGQGHLNGNTEKNKKNKKNKTNDDSSNVIVPLELFPLIFNRMKSVLAQYQIYNHNLSSNVDTRQASVTYDFVQNYLTPQLVGHFSQCPLPPN